MGCPSSHACGTSSRLRHGWGLDIQNTQHREKCYVHRETSGEKDCGLSKASCVALAKTFWCSLHGAPGALGRTFLVGLFAKFLPCQTVPVVIVSLTLRSIASRIFGAGAWLARPYRVAFACSVFQETLRFSQFQQ